MSERHGSFAGIRGGVLLINLGTPSAPTTKAIRSYLREFLSDPRVIEIPRLIWLPILYGAVLPLRPRRIVDAYRSIWLPEGSPLLVHTRRQRQALGEALERRGLTSVKVEMAMCYGQPSIAAALEKLCKSGVTRLVVLPAYPQYSATTTAAAFDAVAKALGKQRFVPELRMLNGYHDDGLYIKACAESIAESRSERGSGEKLLFSFHGLPKRNITMGDPYRSQCCTTAGLIARELGLEWSEWLITFQSRFGFAEWLKPYTDESLRLLARQGVRSVDVFCPGFAADCLETIEEIGVQNRAFFLEAGGERFHRIPSLNADAGHIECLARLAEDALR